MSTIQVPRASTNGDAVRMERSITSWRSFVSFTLSTLTVLATIVALVPLFSVLYMLIVRGGARLDADLFLDLPPPPGSRVAGGVGNAIVGTLLMVGIASAISVPFGILAAIYLSEFGSESKLATAVRFSAKVLTGLPSILAGVFAYALVVLHFGGFSAVAGGIALALLMLPTVTLTAEESLIQVPRKMREAAYGLGATPTQVVMKIVVPTGLPGILTGVMLAVARAAGETAPLLFTALFSEYWFSGKLAEPTASLAVVIYNFSGSPFPNQIELAWAASLVLVVIVLLLNIAGQLIARRAH